MTFIESINPSFTETNFSKHPAITGMGLQNDPDVIWLVLYNGATGEIFVDERAPEWYKKLATFHEEICCKHLHEELIPDITSDSKRCSIIEGYILRQLADNPLIRSQYASARQKMFKFLLAKGLSGPAFEETFKQSLTTVEKAIN